MLLRILPYLGVHPSRPVAKDREGLLWRLRSAIRLAQPFPPVLDTLAKHVLAVNGLFNYVVVGDSFVNQFLR